MASNSGSEPRTPVADPRLDEVLRDAGFAVTDAGKQRWRERLSTPISAEALDEGQRMLQQARGTAA